MRWSNGPDATPLSLAPPWQRGRGATSISLERASHSFTTISLVPMAVLDSPRRVAVRGMVSTALHRAMPNSRSALQKVPFFALSSRCFSPVECAFRSCSRAIPSNVASSAVPLSAPCHLTLLEDCVPRAHSQPISLSLPNTIHLVHISPKLDTFARPARHELHDHDSPPITTHLSTRCRPLLGPNCPR